MSNAELIAKARERAPRGRGHGEILLTLADALEAAVSDTTPSEGEREALWRALNAVANVRARRWRLPEVSLPIAGFRDEDVEEMEAAIAAALAVSPAPARDEWEPGEREKIVALVRDLIDPDDCWFDHHGGCQAHGYLSLQPGQICPHAEAKAWLPVTEEEQR